MKRRVGFSLLETLLRHSFNPRIMTADWRELIERIHRSPLKAVLAVTGGGASAIAELLSVPGGSRTVLGAVVPYSSSALASWLGKRPEQFCGEETALAMAAVAYERAAGFAAGEETTASTTVATADGPETELIGLACTASLVSDRPKRGPHRCYIAVQGRDFSVSLSLVLEKGARDRLGEETLVSQLILLALARACELDEIPPLALRPGEEVLTEQAAGAWLLLELLQGNRSLVWSLPDGELVSGEVLATETLTDGAGNEFPPPVGLLCGAFNPLHDGHRQLRAAAEKILEGPVYYEMSLKNVEKPPLDFLSIERRLAHFINCPVALTAAPLFAQKAAAIPGVTFVVGVDTAERIIDPRFYDNNSDALRAALEVIRAQRCRFLVAGRTAGDRFETLDDLAVPAEFADLFIPIPAAAFRFDISSTDLRRRAAAE